MTETMWIVLYAIASGAFGRIVKVYPKVPKSALPWTVIAAGYAISFGMAMYNGAAVADAAMSSWTGLVAGIAAVGGHEALKPLLAKFLGEDLATKALGKLPKAKPKSKAAA